MTTGLAFLLAAAAGALIRAEAGRRFNRHEGLPAGTLLVNVVGSFLLGWMSNLTPPAMTVLGIGGLGALTTFSSFARDAVALVEWRKLRAAALYVVLSCGLGVGAAALGILLAPG